jgi:hypothetical protein
MTYNKIVMVLDASGSMIKHELEYVQMVNSVIEEQRDINPKAKFSLFKSHRKVDIVYNKVSIKDVPEFTRDIYSPFGGSAIYDAIGMAFDKTHNGPLYYKPNYIPCILYKEPEVIEDPYGWNVFDNWDEEIGPVEDEVEDEVEEDEVEVEEEDEVEEENINIIIMTDGEDNCSQKYRPSDIDRQVTYLKTKGWNFTFIGANPDTYIYNIMDRMYVQSQA